MFEFILQILPIAYRNLPTDNNKIYVYILGESSAYGYPYNISYSKIIQYITGNKINNKEIEVVLLAYPGDTLFDQYKKYLAYKCFNPFKKGILLAYIGTNDWTNKTKDVSNQIYLKIYLAGFLKNYFSGVHDFRYEYERIIRLAKRFGDDMYVSTVAGNYAGCMPNNVSSLINNKELKENIDGIDNLIIDKQYAIALEKCNKILKENEDKSQIWYRIGKIYERQNRVKEAKAAYLNAIEYDGWDARPTRYQNNIITNLAKKYNIPFIDTFDKLNSSENIVGYNFFLDKIHPSIELHKMIAVDFINLLSKKYKINIIAKNLSNDRFLQYFKLNDNSLFDAYKNIFGEIFAYSFVDGIVDIYNIEKLKEYTEKMSNLDIDISKKEMYVNTCNMLVAYLNKNKKEVLNILYNKKLIDKLNKVTIFCYKFKWENELIIEKIMVKNQIN